MRNPSLNSSLPQNLTHKRGRGLPELGAAPVPSLGVVPDGVISSEADPLGNGPVLPLLLGKDLLDLESFVGRLQKRCVLCVGFFLYI